MSGFLDDIIHREISETKGNISDVKTMKEMHNPSPQVLVYVDGVEVGYVEIPTWAFVAIGFITFSIALYAIKRIRALRR